MKILLRRDSIGFHTNATLFMGEPDKTLANCGRLTMRPDDYDVLRAALLLASRQPLFPNEIEIRGLGE